MIDIQGFKNVPGDLSVHPEIRARSRREGVKQGYTYEDAYGLPNNSSNKIDTSNN